MPHPETRVYFEYTFKKEGRRLFQQLPEKKGPLTDEEADRIVESADFRGILTMNKPGVRYDMTAKDGRLFSVRFEPNWRTRYPRFHDEQYQDEAENMADILEEVKGSAVVVVLRG